MDADAASLHVQRDGGMGGAGQHQGPVAQLPVTRLGRVDGPRTGHTVTLQCEDRVDVLSGDGSGNNPVVLYPSREDNFVGNTDRVWDVMCKRFCLLWHHHHRHLRRHLLKLATVDPPSKTLAMSVGSVRQQTNKTIQKIHYAHTCSKLPVSCSKLTTYPRGYGTGYEALDSCKSKREAGRPTHFKKKHAAEKTYSPLASPILNALQRMPTRYSSLSHFLRRASISAHPCDTTIT